MNFFFYGLHNWKSENVIYWDEDSRWKRALGMVKGNEDQEFGGQVLRYPSKDSEQKFGY